MYRIPNKKIIWDSKHKNANKLRWNESLTPTWYLPSQIAKSIARVMPKNWMNNNNNSNKSVHCNNNAGQINFQGYVSLCLEFAVCSLFQRPKCLEIWNVDFRLYRSSLRTRCALWDWRVEMERITAHYFVLICTTCFLAKKNRVDVSLVRSFAAHSNIIFDSHNDSRCGCMCVCAWKFTWKRQQCQRSAINPQKEKQPNSLSLFLAHFNQPQTKIKYLWCKYMQGQ